MICGLAVDAAAGAFGAFLCGMEATAGAANVLDHVTIVCHVSGFELLATEAATGLLSQLLHRESETHDRKAIHDGLVGSLRGAKF